MPRPKGKKNKKNKLTIYKYPQQLRRLLTQGDIVDSIKYLQQQGYILKTEEAVRLIEEILIPRIQEMIDQRIQQVIQDIIHYLPYEIYPEGIIIKLNKELTGNKFVENGRYYVIWKRIKWEFLFSSTNYPNRLAIGLEPAVDEENPNEWSPNISTLAGDIVGFEDHTHICEGHALTINEMPSHRHTEYQYLDSSVYPDSGWPVYGKRDNVPLYSYNYANNWANNDTGYTGGPGELAPGMASLHRHGILSASNDPQSVIYYYYLSHGIYNS